MLTFLLDEHISRRVAKGLRQSSRREAVYAMAEWREGHLLGQDDDACLREAAANGLIFVTYDLRTIPPLLKTWIEAGIEHGGVIFVDEKAISPANIGGLVRALTQVAKASEDWEWTGRVLFLRRRMAHFLLQIHLEDANFRHGAVPIR